VIARKTEKPKTMNQETSRYWEEIDNGRASFDWSHQVAQQVAKVQKADLLAFYDAFISSKGPKRAKLTSQLFGKNHPLPPVKLSATEIHVGSIAQFKHTLPLYPSAISQSK